MKKFKEIILITFSGLFFLLSCNKEVSVNPEDTIPSKGTIIVESYPSRAKIYLNDKNTGKLTPDSIRWLKENSYKITLKIENYRDTVLNIPIKKDDTKEIFVDFNNNPGMRGSILCKTNPSDAEITFMDSVIGKKTPYTISNLLPGKYKIKFTKKGYWDDSLIVNVKSGVVTNGELSLVDSSLWVLYTKQKSGLPSDFLNCVITDHNSNVWIGTNDSGLARLSNNKWTIYNSKNSILPENIITALAVDNLNNVWIGTYSSGLVKFDGTNFTLFTSTNSQLPGNSIRALEVDSSGKVWIGTYNSGIAIFDNGQWSNFNKDKISLPSYYINTIKCVSANKILVGTHDGLLKYENGKWALMDLYADFDSSYPFRTNNIKAVEAEGKYYWIGIGQEGQSEGGSIHFNGKTWFGHMKFPSASVISMCTNKSNNLWVGTAFDGLAVLNKTSYTLITFYKFFNSPLPVNTINYIHIDSNNAKWIATFGGGLLKYKGN